MSLLEGILLLVLFLSVLVTVGISLKVGISPMPTSPSVAKAVQNILPPEVRGEIWELGSGWGTLLAILTRKYPQNTLHGVEYSPFPFLFSRLWKWFWRHTNTTLHWGDFWEFRLDNAGLVVCYLYTGAMPRLKEKLEQELCTASWVVTHTFAIPGWKPTTILYADDMYKTPVYLYQRQNQDKRGLSEEGEAKDGTMDIGGEG